MLASSYVRAFVIVAAISFFPFSGDAQTNIKITSARPVVKKPKPIRTEFSGGASLNTDGWSVYAQKGFVRSDDAKYSDMFYNLRLFELVFSEHKNPKEIKRSLNENSLNGGGEKTRPFIYGKIDNFYSLRLGYGFRKMIAGKPEPGTVSIHWVGTAGISIGLEKPYYIDAYVPQDNSGALIRQTIKYADSTKGSFLNDSYIIGSAGFSKGLNEIKVVPGIHLKTALHFDFAPNKHNVLAVETGASAEIYTRNVELMANQKATPYFLNLFASFQFGRRW